MYSENKQSDYVAPDFYNRLSIVLSNSLDDIGVNMYTVQMRRRLALALETTLELQAKLVGVNASMLIFGSQTEGTTTLDLNSDIDLLVSQNINVMQNMADWKHNHANVLMIKLPTTVPQHYLLQRIYSNVPEPVRVVHLESIPIENVVLQSDHIVLRSDKFYDFTRTILFLGCATDTLISGPAVTIENFDFVSALPVHGKLPEIQDFIERDRPGHWPTQELLENVRDCVNFLVPLGYVFSNNKCVEWRLSANMIERELMFSLNITQIQCYVVLKLLKCSLFIKHKGNSKGLTSFHCKTILFYTIEKYPLNLWKPHNLVQVIKLCLKTLKRWLKSGMCPHFIIPDVNLFDGKIEELDRLQLYRYVSSMIRTDLIDIFQLEFEHLNERMMIGVVGNIPKDFIFRRQVHTTIWKYLYTLINSSIVGYNSVFLYMKQSLDCCGCIAAIRKRIKRALEFYNVENKITRQCAKRFTIDLFSNLATTTTSVSIWSGLRMNPLLYDLFKYGFNSDIASSRLKFASVLYCTGHMKEAEYIIDDVERRLCQQLVTLCVWEEPKLDIWDTPVLVNLDSLFIKNISICIRFFKKDAYCIPTYLLYDLAQSSHIDHAEEVTGFERDRMDSFESDPKAFLYFLQYLIYGSLRNRESQLSALQKLDNFVSDENLELYHPETAMNMLAHCAEMEGDIEFALIVFRESLKKWPRLNIAVWHIRRLQRLIEERNYP